MGSLARLAPADLRPRGVADPLTAEDFAAQPRIVKTRDPPGGQMLIETPRCREYTGIPRGLGARGRKVLEIAGRGLGYEPDRRRGAAGLGI
jgi:hypothetical protein